MKIFEITYHTDEGFDTYLIKSAKGDPKEAITKFKEIIPNLKNHRCDLHGKIFKTYEEIY